MNSTTTTAQSFLFATWEGGGNVAPVVTLARKLIARGHSVRLMSDACNRAEAESAGIVFVPWTRAPSRPTRGRESCPVRDWEAASPPEGIARLVDRIMFGPALEYAQDLLAELEREPVDLVINSDMLFGVLAGCESIGQRCAIFTANLCYYPLAGLPSFGPGLPPPQTDAERSLHEQIREGTRALLNSGIGGLNRARLALGLAQSLMSSNNWRLLKAFLSAPPGPLTFPLKRCPPRSSTSARNWMYPVGWLLGNHPGRPTIRARSCWSLLAPRFRIMRRFFRGSLMRLHRCPSACW